MIGRCGQGGGAIGKPAATRPLNHLGQWGGGIRPLARTVTNRDRTSDENDLPIGEPAEALRSDWTEGLSI
ncbi:hypothetical protein chiPu_0018625 [Chiloscyllium punctatum]|uniref:Uncharacterized protein n=1 Tax=Chiloscyllium punctatum TaxID=137246 RepID=A0A401RPB5_CHIPU|nr:hypothetical protein [Chiloscyllium punctatum]